MDVAVEQGVALVSLRDEGDRVVAVLESSAGTEEVTAGWVLGADGAGSVVRHATGLRLEGWEDGEWRIVHRHGDRPPERDDFPIPPAPRSGADVEELT